MRRIERMLGPRETHTAEPMHEAMETERILGMRQERLDVADSQNAVALTKSSWIRCIRLIRVRPPFLHLAPKLPTPFSADPSTSLGMTMRRESIWRVDDRRQRWWVLRGARPERSCALRISRAAAYALVHAVHATTRVSLDSSPLDP